MRVISLFRSINKKIYDILSVEKDLLRLEKDERIMKSIRMLLKCTTKTKLKLLPIISGNKFLFFDHFASETNILFCLQPIDTSQGFIFTLKINFIMKTRLFGL